MIAHALGDEDRAGGGNGDGSERGLLARLAEAAGAAAVQPGQDEEARHRGRVGGRRQVPVAAVEGKAQAGRGQAEEGEKPEPAQRVGDGAEAAGPAVADPLDQRERRRRRDAGAGEDTRVVSAKLSAATASLPRPIAQSKAPRLPAGRSTAA